MLTVTLGFQADTHPVFNLTRTHSRAMLEYFYVQAFVPPVSA